DVTAGTVTLTNTDSSNVEGPFTAGGPGSITGNTVAISGASVIASAPISATNTLSINSAGAVNLGGGVFSTSGGTVSINGASFDAGIGLSLSGTSSLSIDVTGSATFEAGSTTSAPTLNISASSISLPPYGGPSPVPPPASLSGSNVNLTTGSLDSTGSILGTNTLSINATTSATFEAASSTSGGAVT